MTPAARVRGVVDTAPLLEREFARLAGLGWFGRNTMLLNQRLGSWFFLAALLTSETLVYDSPIEADHCGTCRRCLDACPTGALFAPHRLDARRCISYLTIEHRGPIAAEFLPRMGRRIFGCDACQDVCPWNRSAATAAEPAFQPGAGREPGRVGGVIAIGRVGVSPALGGAAILRSGWEGMRRNAEIAEADG